ncbi:hypothetical protein [Prosthecobacter dejongeii]|uniref:Uncharacterized protein n=1 Tax=Prosthecobacter dejongeii TaxID=48465 RepID=A0A7W7YKW5_9BACT|nr:hypothetical protein [Prosthecobacter dejongeii]MBB5037964.1 hypothetical protein [Prosthecobacter dejongeii]
MKKEDFELVRTKSGDELAAVVETLTTAGVPHRVSSSQAAFDITEVGRGDYPADMMVMVSRADLHAARLALEGSFAETELPADHFLHTASDEEILEILSVPADWDPFVVVHARRLAADRDIKPAEITVKSAEQIQALEMGRPAARWHLVLGWFSVLLGGIVGMGIGYSLAYMKESHAEGEFYTYDLRTREIGRWMMWSGVVMLVVWRFILASR